jgi:hypothetical protein
MMGKVKMYISAIYIMLLSMATAGKLLLIYLLPQYDYPLYWVVPGFFLLFYAVALSYVLKPSLPAKKFLEAFMLFKTIKLISSLAVMLLLAFFCREQAANLLVTFLIYYLIMMLPETLYGTYIRKRGVSKE